jgi:exosortase A-associated hydrolase 2
MSARGGVTQQGELIPCATGSRFRLVSAPADRDPCGTMIFVHAFAEEMNKSRRMSARMARLLASAGWRVVQKDLCGCGDSSGEFRDASWAAWVDDVQAELALVDRTDPVWLCCLRAGALLAPAVLAARPQVNLLLWQPVMSGAQHLQQFLRLHAGARIAGSGKATDGPSPAQLLRSGVTVEIGGYELGAALAAGMEQATFDVPPDFAGRIVWFELSLDDAPQPTPQASRIAQRLRDRNIAVDLEVLNGPPFWQTQEIEECELLLQRSLASLETGGGRAVP